MKFYKVYAKKNESKKKEYFDVHSGFHVLDGDFSKIMSIPFLNCFVLLKNKAFLYSFFLFLIDIISLRSVKILFNFSHTFGQGVFTDIFFVFIKFSLSFFIFYFIGNCGAFLEQKNLENKGFLCIFNSMASSKKEARLNAVKNITNKNEISISI